MKPAAETKAVHASEELLSMLMNRPDKMLSDISAATGISPLTLRLFFFRKDINLSPDDCERVYDAICDRPAAA
ncbi:MAG: hypothetical protein LBH66_08995 [Oscillospiraceae bacterium]|jgi:hypothetical protein|nr:hypothetical protein [Oscillospiraceae bacterium]